MTELKGSLKLEENSSSPSPPQSQDSNSDIELNNENLSPPSPPNSDSDSNSNSPPSDDSSSENSSPSPEKSPQAPAPSSSESVPISSNNDSPSSLSPSSSPPSPPPPVPNQSPPPPEEQSPPPPSSTPTHPPPSVENSRPPPSSTPSPPPPTSSETSKSPPSSPTFSTPSTNASINSSLGSSQQSIAPPPPSSANASQASSPSGGGDSSNQTTKETNSTNSSYEVVVDATVAGAFFIIFFVALFFIVKRTRKHKRTPPGNYTPPHANMDMKSDSLDKESPLVNRFGGRIYPSPEPGFIAGCKTFFAYEELMEMTDGFTHENIIGEGGFGYVYKGRLPDGRFVAVKRLKVDSGQGDREFKAEVDIISRIHHKHLVSLVGYCIAENQRLLIYDFVGNQTLEHHLHGQDMPVLEWPNRVKIAVGAARGLAYLHEDCQPRIIHRDIKSANILLEDDFEAQVADFGLARFNDTTQTHVSTRVMGTFGYLAPEYASSGKLTDRSDVYSFGVVLLELITGRKPVDSTQPLGEESLVEWARPRLIQALESGDYSELIDPRLEKRYIESEVLMMIEAAGACVRHCAAKRPRMSLVARALDFEGLDLSNGVKVGDSTCYNSEKYSDEISLFRKMALGSDTGSECDILSDDLTSMRMSHGRASRRSEYSLGEFHYVESEIQPFKKSDAYDDGDVSANYGGRCFE